MQLTVKKWGNSVGVRIPAPILNALKLEADHLIDMRVEDGKIIIEPISHGYSLEQLLAGITPENLHREADSGAPVGKELL